MIEFIEAVSNTAIGRIHAVYRDKPLIFTRATFQEKLISHYQAVNEVYSYLPMQYEWIEKMTDHQRINSYKNNQDENLKRCIKFTQYTE